VAILPENTSEDRKGAEEVLRIDLTDISRSDRSDELAATG
jgi:hypothetical protein